jgi:endoglucanase
MPKREHLEAPFLRDLLDARSPSGYEAEAQAVFDRYVESSADVYQKDSLGNRIATINAPGRPRLMLAGHMDELGLIIHYIDDKGFLYFQPVGGHDRSIISGRRVLIQTRHGVVKGVTGKRAIHLMDPDDRKKVPEFHQMWIDIGAANGKEARKLVAIGDVATYEHGFELLRGTVGVARAFDNKCGAYVVGETLRRLAKVKDLQACVAAVATTQEEIGCRGAGPSAYRVDPDFAVAVDVGHATDHPDCDKRKTGEFKLGGGPIITRGANINPKVYQMLVAAAEAEKIPCQFEAEPGPTGTDARTIQLARAGIATGLVSVPLRYMHTPSELVDLQDVENVVRLLVAFAQRLKSKDHGAW